MSKRLIWNFEINGPGPINMPSPVNEESNPVRWESRFFWPSDAIILLNGLDESFLNLSNYKSKHRVDTYWILPNANYNLKVRRETLLYKPKLAQTPHAIAYGKKINLNEQPPELYLPETEQLNAITLLTQIKQHGQCIQVDKEMLTYKFNTTPTTTLELSKLCINNKTYFSANIESRALFFVEFFKEQLLNDQTSCDYVTFLKRS